MQPTGSFCTTGSSVNTECSPGTVQPLAPDGVRELLETLGPTTEEPHVVLAKHCEARMQQLLTELYVNLDGVVCGVHTAGRCNVVVGP